MSDKKFVYKLGGVDQLVIAIILATFLIFGAIVASDKFYTQKTTNVSSSADIQNLVKEKERLEAEIEKFRQEGVVVEEQ